MTTQTLAGSRFCPGGGFFIAFCHGSIQLVKLIPHRLHFSVLYDLSGLQQLDLKNQVDCRLHQNPFEEAAPSLSGFFNAFFYWSTWVTASPLTQVITPLSTLATWNMVFTLGSLATPSHQRSWPINHSSLDFWATCCWAWTITILPGRTETHPFEWVGLNQWAISPNCPVVAAVAQLFRIQIEV